MTTLADVARLAGVTKATVSYVVNHKGTVSEKTRKKVEAAIQTLNYQPNLLARGLSDGRTRILGLVINTIANPFYAELAEEVQRAARKRGYHVLLYSTAQTDSGAQEALTPLYSLVDGLLLTRAAVPQQELQRASERGIPLVLCLGWEGDEQARQFPLVYYDHYLGGSLAAEHLLQLGHRRCGVIIPAPHHTPRLEGFRATLAAAGAGVAPPLIQACADATIGDGYQAAEALLAMPHPPTAVFATNDLLAIGAMDAIVDHGLRVPDDLSVVGFDDIHLASQVRPSLTSVALPQKELAGLAVELLMEYIEGQDRAATPQNLRLTPHLVVRQSTAPPALVDQAISA